MSVRELSAGDQLDGYEVTGYLHAGAMARIYHVKFASGHANPGFDMVMKVPRMSAHEGPEAIVSFETEQRLMPMLTGSHVPRFVGAGDLSVFPYLVMELVHGETLQTILDSGRVLELEAIRQIGSALARACHSLHRQNVVHQDLKPANVLVKPDGSVVLLDFGLSYHGDLPDLLAEETRKPVGTNAYMAPEQVVGIRGDARSDLFAIGVMLYEMMARELPFGDPVTTGGLRQRLWKEPRPLRSMCPDCPEWFQEIVLRLLEPQSEHRYPSAKHLALDLDSPGQVAITARGRRTKGAGGWVHLRRWLRAAGLQYEPSSMPSRQGEEVPVVVVAVPSAQVTEATLYSLRQGVARSIGVRPGARLSCVTIVSQDQAADAETQRRLLEFLQRWAEPLDMSMHQASFHVIGGSDVASAIVRYAKRNAASIIVMGAATHGLKLQPFVPTIPIKVAMMAPCSVILVKQDLPVFALAEDD